jgi:hypothetical protein
MPEFRFFAEPQLMESEKFPHMVLLNNSVGEEESIKQ